MFVVDMLLILFVCFRCSIRSGRAMSDWPVDANNIDYQADDQAKRSDYQADDQAKRSDYQADDQAKRSDYQADDQAKRSGREKQ